MTMKCENCGRIIEDAESVLWLFDFPHHEDCANEVMDEVRLTDKGEAFYPDDPRGTR